MGQTLKKLIGVRRAAVIGGLKTLRFFASNRFARWALLAYIRGDLDIGKDGVKIRHRSEEVDFDLKIGEISREYNYYTAESMMSDPYWRNRIAFGQDEPERIGPALGIFGRISW